MLMLVDEWDKQKVGQSISVVQMLKEPAGGFSQSIRHQEQNKANLGFEEFTLPSEKCLQAPD